jgi:hypothetical protein
MRRQLCFWVLLGLLLLGQPVFAKKAMEKALDSWIGFPVEKVIQTWGYPDEEKTVAGHKLYVWGKPTTLDAPFCSRTLEVDENNVVKSWEYSGGNCPFSWAKGRAYKKYGNPGQKGD